MIKKLTRNKATWNLRVVKKQLRDAYNRNSEIDLLRILKQNSFLFYELFERKYSIQPIFHEVSFGGDLKCDFAWLNDNSDGPQWVIVEVERPRLKLFTTKDEPTSHLNHAIEQVKSWRRYFNEYSTEKKRIFGAVSNFRFILIVGDKESWSKEKPTRWRIDQNKSDIEIKSSDLFFRAVRILEEKPSELRSFIEKPVSLNPSELKAYWENYGYMERWRKIIS